MKTKISKRLLSAFLAVLMAVAIVPVATLESSAASNIVIAGVELDYADGDFFTKSGGPCEVSTDVFSNGTCHNHSICTETTDSRCNCMRYWPDGDINDYEVDLLASQCLGYARYCQYKVYGYHDANKDSEFTDLGAMKSSDCTETNVKNKLKNCNPTTHIRVKRSSWQHSMIVVKTTDTGITITDANFDNVCGVRLKTYTWSEFAKYLDDYGVAYINEPNEDAPSSGSSSGGSSGGSAGDSSVSESLFYKLFIKPFYDRMIEMIREAIFRIFSAF